MTHQENGTSHLLRLYHSEKIQKVNTILLPRIYMATLTRGFTVTPEIISINTNLVWNHIVDNIHISTTMLPNSMNDGNNSASGILW